MSEPTAVPSAEPVSPVAPPEATHDEKQGRSWLSRFLGSSAGRNLGLVIALLVLFAIGAVRGVHIGVLMLVVARSGRAHV